MKKRPSLAVGVLPKAGQGAIIFGEGGFVDHLPVDLKALDVPQFECPPGVTSKHYATVPKTFRPVQLFVEPAVSGLVLTSLRIGLTENLACDVPAKIFTRRFSRPMLLTTACEKQFICLEFLNTTSEAIWISAWLEGVYVCG